MEGKWISVWEHKNKEEVRDAVRSKVQARVEGWTLVSTSYAKLGCSGSDGEAAPWVRALGGNTQNGC